MLDSTTNTTSTLNVERVQRAVALLRNVAEQNLPFDIESWFSDEEDPLDCGTAACAGGWMARDPWMQAEGLRIDDACPAYGELSDYDAMAAFIGLKYKATWEIFCSATYPMDRVTADMVADRLERLLTWT